MQQRNPIFSSFFCLLCLAFALSSVSIQAQNNDVPILEAKPVPPKKPSASHMLRPLYRAGLHGGLLSGYGFSGAITLPLRISIQGTFFLMKFSDNLFYSFGTEFQYHFSDPRTHNLYILLGSGYYYNSTNSTNTLNNPFRLGIGFGYHYFLTPEWMVDLQLNITWFTGFGSSILPLPQAGIFYVFE